MLSMIFILLGSESAGLSCIWSDCRGVWLPGRHIRIEVESLAVFWSKL